MEENKAHYKWRKLFAAKRYGTKDGVIKLTPLEQQELLDDIKPLVENNSVLDDVMTELPSFLYINYNDEIAVGVHGDTEVTKEWKEFIKKIGCSL